MFSVTLNPPVGSSGCQRTPACTRFHPRYRKVPVIMSALVSSSQPAQLTLALEPGLANRYASALEVVRAGAYTSHRPLKAIAADMDMPVSTLSRKLSGHPDDPRHFTLSDLELYIQTTGDTLPIAWLAARYLQTADDRRQQAIEQLASIAPMIMSLIRSASA